LASKEVRIILGKYGDATADTFSSSNAYTELLQRFPEIASILTFSKGAFFA
jgi:hypothetical protein